jgi:hypothetical protein
MAVNLFSVRSVLFQALPELVKSVVNKRTGGAGTGPTGKRCAGAGLCLSGGRFPAAQVSQGREQLERLPQPPSSGSLALYERASCSGFARKQGAQPGSAREQPQGCCCHQVYLSEPAPYCPRVFRTLAGVTSRLIPRTLLVVLTAIRPPATVHAKEGGSSTSRRNTGASTPPSRSPYPSGGTRP